MPDSTAKRWRNLKWAAGICAGVLAIALIGVFLERPQKVNVSGPEVKLCYTLGWWANRHGFKTVCFRLLRLAESLRNRRLDSAVRSGELIVVTFHDPGTVGVNVLSQVTSDLGKSNGWDVIRVRLKASHATTDIYEVLLEPKGKEQMEAFLRELERACARPMYF